ncbi:thioredoxin-domain-containing protein [Xylariaceae sp. FL0804]|nr:thioredoxin-domain-containing protein [Xylariaceae sp. FL0804]
MHVLNLHPALASAVMVFLAALPTAHAGMYLKSSPVVQVDAKNYDRLIAKSNHTSVVEFYAPWCGHCQNLKPAYEKAAKNLEGLAKVAAVNCDEDENKPLCGQFGVQGFPTLKTVRPGKGRTSKPIVEDYNGPRTAKGIVDTVVNKINNHVARVTDKDLDSFLSTKNESAKAILFTEKGSTSALLKSLAIDFLDVISVAQVRDKETKANEMFGIASYPTLILLPGGDQEGLVYGGEMKKAGMLEFLSQAGAPNPDPAPAKAKAGKKADKKEKAAKASTSTASEPSAEPSVDSQPDTASPAPAIPAITSAQKLTNECLNTKSHTCVLAFVPSTHGEAAEKALLSLSEIAHKHAQAQRHLFPFYEVHHDKDDESGGSSVFKGLGLSGEVEVVAVNGKRGWWRHYEGDMSVESVEGWIDAIRMSEGTRHKLPEAVVGEVVAAAETETETEATAEAGPETVEIKVEETIEVELPPDTESASFQGAEPAPEATDAPPKHEEL